MSEELNYQTPENITPVALDDSQRAEFNREVNEIRKLLSSNSNFEEILESMNSGEGNENTEKTMKNIGIIEKMIDNLETDRKVTYLALTENVKTIKQFYNGKRKNRTPEDLQNAHDFIETVKSYKKALLKKIEDQSDEIVQSVDHPIEEATDQQKATLKYYQKRFDEVLSMEGNNGFSKEVLELMNKEEKINFKDLESALKDADNDKSVEDIYAIIDFEYQKKHVQEILVKNENYKFNFDLGVLDAIKTNKSFDEVFSMLEDGQNMGGIYKEINKGYKNMESKGGSNQIAILKQKIEEMKNQKTGRNERLGVEGEIASNKKLEELQTEFNKNNLNFSIRSLKSKSNKEGISEKEKNRILKTIDFFGATVVTNKTIKEMEKNLEFFSNIFIGAKSNEEMFAELDEDNVEDKSEDDKRWKKIKEVLNLDENEELKSKIMTAHEIGKEYPYTEKEIIDKKEVFKDVESIKESEVQYLINLGLLGWADDKTEYLKKFKASLNKKIEVEKQLEEKTESYKKSQDVLGKKQLEEKIKKLHGEKTLIIEDIKKQQETLEEEVEKYKLLFEEAKKANDGKIDTKLIENVTVAKAEYLDSKSFLELFKAKVEKKVGSGDGENVEAFFAELKRKVEQKETAFDNVESELAKINLNVDFDTMMTNLENIKKSILQDLDNEDKKQLEKQISDKVVESVGDFVENEANNLREKYDIKDESVTEENYKNMKKDYDKISLLYSKINKSDEYDFPKNQKVIDFNEFFVDIDLEDIKKVVIDNKLKVIEDTLEIDEFIKQVLNVENTISNEIKENNKDLFKKKIKEFIQFKINKEKEDFGKVEIDIKSVNTEILGSKKTKLGEMKNLLNKCKNYKRYVAKDITNFEKFNDKAEKELKLYEDVLNFKNNLKNIRLEEDLSQVVDNIQALIAPFEDLDNKELKNNINESVDAKILVYTANYIDKLKKEFKIIQKRKL